MKLSPLLVYILYGIVTLAAAASNTTCPLSDNGKAGPNLSTKRFWKNINHGELIENLTDENFDKWVADNPRAFVMYYEPRCMFCRDCRQDFACSADEIAKYFKFGSVDCVKAKTICNNGGKAKTGYPKISEVPTFHLFKNGIYNDTYSFNDRTPSAFNAWLAYKIDH